ncbi:MAG: tripartite tricarboxylate transporter substrate binding protein [Alicycliphilus sp.]|jgi:tripartite-type tricarboxylate transporter receptor subunit TctC|nr:tripartite tricarboxylate transporter substrate binding protein [Alicycliphilus sp.]MCA0440960.1 tripartite tricarboxylate transporter substrate binding protein [Pseudomonadota bacterium]MBP7329320.1 tripartite tricarboxylate transporter substrate binding protein [Alicycliphilus sp.]MBP8778427.1 tripartite tricarboxylate transporter substrate binding protein [Alicycliphilus sp.]TXJ06329.1 MAG: tripartite tricarboxylate transporter substrate binding protein [Alicycliphilus sp.]
MNRRNFNVLAAALAAFTAIPATAQSTWPNKPITLVVPYAPGGTADALARVLAQHLGTRLKVSVVVLNKAGASGVIGAASVAQAPADGYTVLYDATPLSINPHLQKLPFDAAKDLQPVALVGVTPMLVVVPKNSPYNTLQELIAAAAKASGKLTFCSGGQGTVQYMGAELFNQGVGIKMLHVPYRAGGLALQAILAGEVDMGFFNLPALSSHIKGGALKPLAITSAKRNPLFPNVPTISEAGVKNYEVYEWNGMFVPSTTPAEIVTRLNTAVREVLAMPEVKARFDALGSEIVGSQPDEFRKRLAAESARWAETIKAAGIKKE